MKCAADWKFKQNVERQFLINQLDAIICVSAVFFIRILGRKVVRVRNDEKRLF